MKKTARDLASVLSYKRREPYQTLHPRFLCGRTNAKPIKLMPNHPKASGSMLKNQGGLNSRILNDLAIALILVQKTIQISRGAYLRGLRGHLDTLGNRPSGLDFISRAKAACHIGNKPLPAGIAFEFSFVSRPVFQAPSIHLGMFPYD